MPLRIPLSQKTHELVGRRGAWQATLSGTHVLGPLWPNLIMAYAAHYSGHMTLGKMSSIFQRDGFTLSDFAADDEAATLAFVQSRIRLAMEYLMSAPEGSSTKRIYSVGGGEYIDGCVESLQWLVSEKSLPGVSYPLIAEALAAGISQFEALQREETADLG